MYIGLLFTFIIGVVGLTNNLRNDNRLKNLIKLTLPFGIFGLFIRDDFFNGHIGSETDFLWGPFLYVLTYYLARRMYKSHYKMEPTYNRDSWYDPEEGREQNWADVSVAIFPIIIALLSPILIPIYISMIIDFFGK